MTMFVVINKIIISIIYLQLCKSHCTIGLVHTETYLIKKQPPFTVIA